MDKAIWIKRGIRPDLLKINFHILHFIIRIRSGDKYLIDVIKYITLTLYFKTQTPDIIKHLITLIH